MIISRTPYRISFFGGGTDYPAWYHEHGGAVLASTIDKYCYITCRYLPPFFDHKIRVVYSQIELRQYGDEIDHPVVRETLSFLKMQRGLEIHHDGDLPARSGIGSSSSFTVGLLHALYALKSKMPSKHQLATEGIYIERERLKETVGSQDQVLAAYGGLNKITFLQNDEFHVTPLTISRGRISELNSKLMLFYTGIKRTASDVASSYVHDLSKKHDQLKAIGKMVDEGISILSSGDDLSAFGKLLHEAWTVKRNLSSKVSNDRIEEMYSESIAAGALGGKVTGAGGGGFLLLFVPEEKRQQVRQRLNKLIHVPFQFESLGSQIVFHDPGVDYAAAEVDRSVNDIGAFQEL